MPLFWALSAHLEVLGSIISRDRYCLCLANGSTLAWLGWQQSRLLLGDFKRLSLIIRCAINRLTFVLHCTSMTCTKQIFSNRREINYWFMSQRAYVEIWSTQEVWRARNRRKRCSSRKSRTLIPTSKHAITMPFSVQINQSGHDLRHGGSCSLSIGSTFN